MMEPCIEYIDLNELPPDLISPEPSKQFVESIRVLGVLEPIILLLEDRQGPHYTVLGGNRRIKAARLAHHLSIPARVYTEEHETLPIERVILDLNVHNSSNVYEETKQLLSLKEKGLTEKELQALTGLTSSTLKKQLSIADMPEYFRDLFTAGQINANLCYEILATPQEYWAEIEALHRDDARSITQDGLKKLRAPKIVEATIEQAQEISVPLPPPPREIEAEDEEVLIYVLNSAKVLVDLLENTEYTEYARIIKSQITYIEGLEAFKKSNPDAKESCPSGYR